jgi:DNA primase
MKDGRQAKFLFLPEGEDPDTLVRSEGRDDFEARFKKATPLSEFLLENLSTQADTSSPEGRARFAELARPLVGRVPKGIYRDLLIEQVANVTQTTVERIAEHVGEAPVEQQRQPRAAARPRLKLTRSLIEQAVRCLLHKPALASLCSDPTRYTNVPLKGSEILAKILELAVNNPQITAGAMIERWRDSGTGRYLEQLAGEQYLETDEALETEFKDILQGLEDLLSGSKTSQRLKELQEKGLQNMSESDKNEYKQLLEQQ